MRPNNEDALIEAPEIGLFGVCDGLGGHAGGEVASSLASQAFPELLQNTDLPVGQALKRSLTVSNDRILEFQTLDPKLQGMGTTFSAVWIRPRGEEAVWVVHIGDSRIYRIREGQIRQVTDDHSPVYRLYKAGRLSQEEARRHPHRNIVERSLGIRHQIQPDIFPIDFRPFDRILICSDGLTDEMTDEEIGGVAGGKDLCPAARELVAEAKPSRRSRQHHAGADRDLGVPVRDVTEPIHPCGPRGVAEAPGPPQRWLGLESRANRKL